MLEFSRCIPAGTQPSLTPVVHLSRSAAALRRFSWSCRESAIAFAATCGRFVREADLLRLLSIAAQLVTACVAGAQTPGFWLVGMPPGGSSGSVQALSQSGSVATGFVAVQPAHPGAGFRWTPAGGREDWGLLPGMPQYSPGYGLSSTGDTIVGWMGTWTERRAYRRIGSGPLQDLGMLPGEVRSEARGVSGDGSIVVGFSEHTQGPFALGQAFRWTESSGMVGLGHLHAGSIRSDAYGVSRDGSTIVGRSVSNTLAAEAFCWTATGGMQALPNLPGATVFTAEGNAVSSDGSVIVGQGGAPSGRSHATYWTLGGVQDLGVLPGTLDSVAWATSDDGAIVGGTSTIGSSFSAFVWTPSTGMLDLGAFLSTYGLVTPIGYRLEEVTAISGDGLTFGGLARNLVTNDREGFVATIPAPSAALVLLTPIIAPRRRRP